MNDIIPNVKMNGTVARTKLKYDLEHVQKPPFLLQSQIFGSPFVSPPRSTLRVHLRRSSSGEARISEISLRKRVSGHALEERTTKFGISILLFCKTVTQTPTNRIILDQLSRSGTSVGANYCEADDAESRQDFKHKIGICKKEARESMYWLRMITVTNPETPEQATLLRKEAQELNLIFNAIIRSTNQKKS